MQHQYSPFGNFKWIALWWFLLWVLWCLLIYLSLSIVCCLSKLLTRFNP